MSASEKLAALGPAIDEMAITEADRLWLDLQPPLIALRAAHPQIVAVVKALEAHRWSEDQPDCFCDVWIGSHSATCLQSKAALAALEEALP